LQADTDRSAWVRNGVGWGVSVTETGLSGLFRLEMACKAGYWDKNAVDFGVLAGKREEQGDGQTDSQNEA